MALDRRTLAAVALAVALAVAADAQTPSKPAPKAPAKGPSDIELVEKVLAARREYQITLETLRAHYISIGDLERAKWAEEELRQYHRIGKQAYRLDMDVPAPTLKAEKNIAEANELYRRAMVYKDKGWGNDYIDNQRRAEILLQQLLTSYPESDKIDDAAYQLGDIYESKAYRQPRRAAAYFERCFQWNNNTQFDARLRAARLYDKVLLDRSRARELYQDVLNTETDPRWLEEARKRLSELGGGQAAGGNM
jgi:TolA-binding protein